MFENQDKKSNPMFGSLIVQENWGEIKKRNEEKRKERKFD